MVQSVALKRPQSGVRGGWWLFHVPLPFAEPCFSCVLRPQGSQILSPFFRSCAGTVAFAVRKATLPVLGHPPLEGTLRCPGPVDILASRPGGTPPGRDGRLQTGAVFCSFRLQPIEGLRSIQTGFWVPNLLAPARTNLQLRESWSSWLIALK